MIDGWDPPIINHYLSFRIAAAFARIGNASVNDQFGGGVHTELDSHANMCVLGKHCYLLSELSTARSVHVAAFSDSAGGLNNVPIVDAMIAYDCKRTNQVYLLILRNALYIEDMDDNLIPPFILQDAGLTVNDKAKIHCEEGTATEEDHTIQEELTGLFIPLQLRSIFSYFPSRKPNNSDLDDGVVVAITPDGPTWDAYDPTFADNERSMTNFRGQMRPSKYIQKEFVEEEDIANINSIMAFDTVNRCDGDAVIAAFRAQEKDMAFTEKDINIGLRSSEVAATAVKPFASDWDPVFESLPVGQDQVGTIISSVSNTLDPQTFYDALETKTAVSKFKMAVGATSIVEPEFEDDLWTETKPWSVNIDISNLENMVD